MSRTDPIETLAVADPDLAFQVRDSLTTAREHVPPERLELLLKETLWALSMELSFGRAVGLGYARLAGAASAETLARYRESIRKAGEEGPTLGRIMAEALVPVLLHTDAPFLERFLHTVRIMTAKGTYTLGTPLEALARLLEAAENASAGSFLELLSAAFSTEMTYNQSQKLTVLLPKSVLSFLPADRPWQIRCLTKVVAQDPALAEFFLDGMQRGLHLLRQDALESFTAQGLRLFAENPDRGRRFFSLESQQGKNACESRQVSAGLAALRTRLNQYLRARTGRPLSVRTHGELPRSLEPPDPVSVLSDARFIYLPETIGQFPGRAENEAFFWTLVRLEAGYHEFGTYDFDLEKCRERSIAHGPPWDCRGSCGAGNRSDLERFFDGFPVPALALDLFTLLEHGRLRLLLSDRYPGLYRRIHPVLRKEAATMPGTVLTGPFFRLALAEDPPGQNGGSAAGWEKEAARRLAADPSVETVGALVAWIYPEVEKTVFPSVPTVPEYRPMAFPFGRRLRPDLLSLCEGSDEEIARKIKAQVEKDGRFKVYVSDIRQLLRKHARPLRPEDLRDIVLRRTLPGSGAEGKDILEPDPTQWLEMPPVSDLPPAEEEDIPIFWYPEWDENLQDYLQRHARVRERTMEGDSEDFFSEVLVRRRYLVGRIRTAFEMLKPQGLKILRQWVEGDAFDHRALIDFAVDRRAGRTPSERLYIKRLKQIRDIGVLLLVDLSRSTANRAAGSVDTVLDVEKEALVLFCEALRIVGDRFAIAGFSGTGRLGVDYYRIKDFEEVLSNPVRRRIGGLTPQRSTRMGAAIRHATSKLETLPCRIRLLLILGDGFPNDVDYKRGVAIADTRRAINEARSKRIHVRAITVNLPGDPKLDELYGNVHHNVISDVRELPDKLLRIYSSLTRH